MNISWDHFNGNKLPHELTHNLPIIDYENTVCSLLQSVELALENHSQISALPYLLYAKHLLDFSIKFSFKLPIDFLTNQHALIMNLQNIFFQNTNLHHNYFINGEFSMLINSFPLFNGMDFENLKSLLVLLKKQIGNQEMEFILHSVHYAMTKGEFCLVESVEMVGGCVEYLRERFGWNFNGVTYGDVEKTKQLFKMLFEQDLC